MQIGIDLGATKIEYVLLDDKNKELERNRAETPKNFADTLTSIIEIIQNLEKKYKSKFIIGICHPGNLDSSTGVIKNAHNYQWLNNKSLIGELKKKIKNDIFSENDANCFSLSEALDGAARHYNSVFGIILGFVALYIKRHILIFSTCMIGSYLVMRSLSFLLGNFPDENQIYEMYEKGRDNYQIVPLKFWMYMVLLAFIFLSGICV